MTELLPPVQNELVCVVIVDWLHNIILLMVEMLTGKYINIWYINKYMNTTKTNNNNLTIHSSKGIT
jgi:hypothetical protein